MARSVGDRDGSEEGRTGAPAALPGVLRSLRSLLVPAYPDGDVPSPVLEAPSPAGEDEPLTIGRSFAFVDISGFTLYCDTHGAHAAIDLLTAFRGVTRAVVARRGVRVGKWMGDGVMLVSVELPPLAAAVAEIAQRSRLLGIDTHAGVATGHVLLFEGDDYVGRPANVAARLCEHASLGENLLAGPLPQLPDWLVTEACAPIAFPGVGVVRPVHRLRVSDEVAAALTGDSPAA